MNYSIDQPTLDNALDICDFKATPGWARPVLVVWPAPENLVDKLLSYDCWVTVVTGDLEDYQQLTSLQRWESHRGTKKLKVVYSVPEGYIAATPLHSFVAVFVFGRQMFNVWHLLARRVLTWNGRLNHICVEYDGDKPEANYGGVHGVGLSITSKTLVSGLEHQYRVVTGKKEIGWLLASYPRCGTHMLASALNSHSTHLTCYGEVFNPNCADGSHMFETPQQVFERSWSSKHHGFSVHTSIDRLGHPLNMAENMFGQRDFWKYIPDYTPTIILTRENLLARYVSHLSAMSTGVWNSTDPTIRESAIATVHVDIQEFERDMKYVQDCWDHAAAYFKYSISVTYEEMMTDFNAVSKKVQAYLQVPYEPVKPATIKLAVSLEETIENYVQVRAWCRRNKFERFLLEQWDV